MNLKHIFDEIRSLYFPNWDRHREWSAVFGSLEQCRDGNTGYCDSNAKVIYLDEKTVRMMSESGFRAFLIHEICHDAGAANHNRAWATRMEQAAKLAESLNEPETARIVRCEIFAYGGTGVLANYDLPNVMDYAEEVVGQNCSIGLDAAIRDVAKYFGHSSAKVRRDFGPVIADVVAGNV